MAGKVLFPQSQSITKRYAVYLRITHEINLLKFRKEQYKHNPTYIFTILPKRLQKLLCKGRELKTITILIIN